MTTKKLQKLDKTDIQKDIQPQDGKTLVINYLRETCINSDAQFIFNFGGPCKHKDKHIHKYYEIFIFGKLPNDPFSKPEKIIVVPPGIQHDPIEKDGCVVLFQCSFNSFSCCYYKRGFSSSFEMQNSINGQLFLNMLHLFLQYARHNSPDFMNVRRNAFLYALSELLEEFTGNLQTKPYYINMALWFIDTHYSNHNLTINDVARHVSLSSHQLNILLKKQYNMTINQMICERRMKEAKKLLTATDIPIVDIAGLCGYAERNYFTNSFRKKYKIPPQTYRLQHSK